MLVDHYQYLWSISAHFTGVPINLYDDDLSGTFLHHILLPSIAKENLSLYQLLIILSIALHFGGNFGQSSWEPTSDIFSFLVFLLFLHCFHMVALNEEALSVMQCPSKSKSRMKKNRCTVQSPINQFTMAVKILFGYIYLYRMSVDDGSTMCLQFGYTQNLVCASIKAC